MAQHVIQSTAPGQAMIDGVAYQRDPDGTAEDCWSVFWYRTHAGPEHPTPNPDHPDVICICGADVFTLRYGVYELIATCAQCGLTDMVYSG